MLQIIQAESFRPIFNPNVALKPTAKKITAITTTTSTVRPLTTISATLKSRVSLTKQQQTLPQHANRAPVKPLSSPSQAPVRVASDSAPSNTKDAPVAEALRGDWRRRWPRPYYPYPSNYLQLPSSRYRRRPNPIPKPYYPQPTYSSYNHPYEDYRFETDFLDQGSYVPKSKPKAPAQDANKDYGIVDTDIGAFYDSQSATYNVPPINSYDPQANYYATGAGSTGGGKGTGTGLGSSVGSGGGGSYSDYGDVDDYKSYSTPKPKTQYKSLPSRAPVKTKTRNKYNSYDEDYRYSSDLGGGGGSQEIDEVTTDANTVAKYNNIYLPQHTIYQTAPKRKPKPRPIKTTTTTYAPPIKFSDTSIDVLTKPLGSATFNLNLSPGTVYSPPSVSYNPPPTSYNPPQTNYNPPQTNYNPPANSFKQNQPIPLQPPATSYGVPIAPPLNSYTYQNSYQNEYGGYPPSIAQNNGNYLNPSQISITNGAAPRSPGTFAEPPSLNQQTLSNPDVSYNSVQSSYDATPKHTQPTRRKPSKVNSKRVSTKRPQLNTDEELAEDDHNERQHGDHYGESYSFYKTMPQPALPNAYDQEEFHTVKKSRKQSKQASNYYERDEKVRTTKKPRQPIEVTLRIPDEDYLDDLVKVVQTTKRPKKKGKQSSSHVLDTEDLRDAYDNNSAYVPKKKKVRYHQTTSDYDNYEDDTEDDEYENDRLSNVNSREETKSTSDTEPTAEGTQDAPYWDKGSSIYKQYGIRARNDHYQVGGSFEVRGYNNGFRPIRNDPSIIHNVNLNPYNVRATYPHEHIAPAIDSRYSNGNRISSTLRSVTSTVKPSTLYVWGGGELPKNHKLV